MRSGIGPLAFLLLGLTLDARAEPPDPALTATVAEDSTGESPAADSATDTAESAAVKSAAPAPISATLLATAPAGSATTGHGDISVSRIQVRAMYLKGSQEATLTLPDGNGRVVIENTVGRSMVRIGGHYNFYNGLIEAWVTYGHLLWKGGPMLQIAASDHIGLGQLYYRQRSLERTREVPLAVGQQFRFGSIQAVVSRASWLLAPLDAPASADKGLIDSVALRFTTTDIIPDIGERLEFLRPDTSAVEYKRASRDLSGNYQFERISMDIRNYLPGARRPDEILMRAYAGHAYKIRSDVTPANPSPSTLPIRDTFELGGAGTLKGYQPGEFRGRGVMLLGAEYALVTPWTFSIRRIRLDVWQSAALFFLEEGRIQNSWHATALYRGEAVRWSAGMGMRFKGKWLNSKKSIVRLYAAQAGDYPARGPVFYALLEVGDR